jgi:hypothetical protein
MTDLMRFGMVERALLGTWIMITTPLIAAALIATYPEGQSGLVQLFQWWSYLAIGAASVIIVMPAIRHIYRELVAPHLPRNPITT